MKSENEIKGIKIEEFNAWRNHHCMSCFKKLYGKKAFIVRTNFSYIYGGNWRLCEECLHYIFNESVIKNALKNKEEGCCVNRMI